MAVINELLANIKNEDVDFVGTVAFRSEDLCLPDGSTLAIGIDGPHWVVVYQKESKSKFVIYEYDHHAGIFKVDKKAGTHEELQKMKELVRYFFAHACSEDLVTIMPPR